MRLPRLNLRLRIAIALATVCISVVGVLGITLYAASEDMERALVEELVTEEVESLVERSRVTDGAASGGGPNLQYYILTSPADYERLEPQIRLLGPGLHKVGQGVNEQRVAVRDTGGKRYMVVYDEGAHELRAVHLRKLLMFSLLTAATVAVVLGYGLAGVLTRQLNDLATRVAKLPPDEPHPPLERADHDKEVAAVAHALDAYHTRVIAVMQREQEFTANASHELRTPLTAIRTSCELLAADDALSDKASRRVAMVAHAATQMTDSIASLLLLARGRGTVEVESVHLGRCVADAVAPYTEDIARKGLTLQVRVPEDTVLQIDRKALQLVLGNLIKNAVAYTQRGYVRVSYAEKRLTVADSGSGIEPKHRQQIFQRYYRVDDKPEGLGLGLAIVRRICEDSGWEIEVESNRCAGSAFTVVLA